MESDAFVRLTIYKRIFENNRNVLNIPLTIAFLSKHKSF